MTGDNNLGGLRIVEFFGVPGVGKSYLAREVRDDGIGRDPLDRYTRAGRAQRIRWKTLLILKQFRATIAIAKWTIEMVRLHRPVGRGRNLKVLFNWTFLGALIWDSRASGGVIVLEQGIAQALWSMKFEAKGKPQAEDVAALMERYVQAMRIVEWTVVHVTASDDRVRDRVGNRDGSSPLDRDVDVIDKARLAEREACQVLRVLGRKARDVPNIRLWSLENDGRGASKWLREKLG